MAIQHTHNLDIDPGPPAAPSATPHPAMWPAPRTGSVVLVIPAFDQERFIGSVVLKARQYVDQVIVVDDGSRVEQRRGHDRAADAGDRSEAVGSGAGVATPGGQRVPVSEA